MANRYFKEYTLPKLLRKYGIASHWMDSIYDLVAKGKADTAPIEAMGQSTFKAALA